MAKASKIDNELLITLVEQRPVLWDKTTKDYKNRIKTLESWKEVSRFLVDGYDWASGEDQDEIDKQVIKKWTNIKDSFVRWIRKYNNAKRSGSSTKPLKKYIYHDQLLFLNKCILQLNEIDDSDEKEIHSDDTTERKTDDEPEMDTSRPKKRIKRLPTVLAEGTMIKNRLEVPSTPTTFDQSFKNRHMAFFAGITPSLENFNEDQICDFQIGVLQLIQSLRTSKNAKANVT